jgi:hypothetical protein
MRLERHVGGLGRARQANYLTARGWREEEGKWRCDRLTALALPLAKALHHQLTFDLTAALSANGWRVVGYSDRGYARMEDPADASLCSLPAALRRQAKREKRPVGELTYALFLGALLPEPGSL